MKVLTPDALIEVLDCVPKGDYSAADKFCGITPLVSPEQLKYASDEGFVQAVEIAVNGKPEYIAWVSTGIDKGFHINAIVQIVEHPSGFINIVMGLETYAASLGCAYVRFNTARMGLIGQARKFGYEAQCVCMTKKL